MPLLRIITNVSKNNIPADFLEKTTHIMARAIGKPFENCICSVSGDVPVSFGGDSKAPGALATLVSIGKLGPKENENISKALAVFIENEIGVPSKRFFITFHDKIAWEVGIDGTTVEERDSRNK